MAKQALGTATSLTDPASWVDRHGDYLFRYALARLHQVELAEDLVQDTFLGALRGREQFAGASSERTWLVSILKRKIIDHLRRQHREQPASDIAADGWMDELFDHSGHWKKAPARWANPKRGLRKRRILDHLRGLPRQASPAAGGRLLTPGNGSTGQRGNL